MLKGKTAIITGAKRGIGNSLLKLFSKNGANIIACIRKEDADFKKECEDLEKKYQNRISCFYFDLNNEEDTKNNILEILKQNIEIDILVNNAGEITTSLFQMTTTSNLKKIFQINFFSPMLIMQLVLKNMIRNKKGSIINISSSAAFEFNAGRSAYASSKSSISTASQVIAREVGSHNVRVNIVAPGLTDTDMLKNSSKPEVIEKKTNEISLKRIANTNEIAKAILFLASDMSSYITGEIIRVDGGL